ncbi:MAG: PIN domain-containing protein [Chloroflexi bacterium]|nr:PIN domain-containing protein [Chloroflexota bacterium]
MIVAFGDTSYWVALIDPNDQWHKVATVIRKSLGGLRIVTTDEVLVEVLTFLASLGPRLRGSAVRFARGVLHDPRVEVLPQTRDSFLAGLALYGQRPDKEYSLTDCIIVNAMWSKSLTDILISDGHFAQEGFNVLIRKE